MFKIFHQNGVLDFQRVMKIDKGFYNLPEKIQNKAKEILQNVENEGIAIFPADWQTKMVEKRFKISE